MLETTGARKAAVDMLEKHYTSVLQMPEIHLQSVAATLQHEMQKHSNLLTHSQRRTVASFLQMPRDYSDATPTFKQSYAPQSGQVFGILQQMFEIFETRLAAAQKEEMAARGGDRRGPGAEGQKGG